MLRLFGWLAVCVFFVASCSTSQFGWKTEPEGEKKAQSGYVEDFDPLSLNDDDIVVQPREEAASTEEERSPEAEKIVVPPEKPAEEMVQGYRVQLLATGDEVQAREVKKDAIFKLEEDVYLVFEAPLYKLRVGDCRTKREAEGLRDEAIRKGFRDAWIVPSKVYRTVGDAPPF